MSSVHSSSVYTVIIMAIVRVFWGLVEDSLTVIIWFNNFIKEKYCMMIQITAVKERFLYTCKFILVSDG